MTNMDNRLVTRRAALTAMAAFAVAPGVALAAPEGARFGAIRIDVTPLRSNGGDDYANWVAAVLPAALHQSFARYLAPGDRAAPTLVARVDEVFLGPEHSTFGNPVADAIDGIQGQGIVLGPRGQQISSYPLYASVGANTYSNMPYQLDITRRRVETLAQSFAQWLPGQMGQ
jgi:hypothetical protein